MDPQELAALDPKLKDVYERVMGAPVPPSTASSPQTSDPAQEQTSVSPFSQAQPPSNPEPATNSRSQFIPVPSSAIPVPQASATTPARVVPAALNATPITDHTDFGPKVKAVVIEKKSGSVKLILFGIVVLIVITVYTLFWTKIFNFNLPFLSK